METKPPPVSTKEKQYKTKCIPCNKSIDSATPETICPGCKRHLSHINPLGIQHDERIMKPPPKPIYKQPTEFTYAICPQDKYSKGFTHETEVREAVIFDRHYTPNPDILNPKPKEQPKENALGGMALLILCAILIIKYIPMIPALIISIFIIIGIPLLLIVLPLLIGVYAVSMANDVANIAKIINEHKKR